MKHVLVNFTNGNQIRTAINGTDDQIQKYYATGRMFNLGLTSDDMRPVSSIVIEPDQYRKAIALIGKNPTFDSLDIITEDGGYCNVFLHESNMYDITFYQNRINVHVENWFEEIVESKASWQQLDNGTTVNELIIICLEFLGYNILETDLRTILVNDDKIETVEPHIINFLKPYQCQNQD